MSLFDAGKASAAITLADLLMIENTPELLALRCSRTDIPVWPILRIAFLRQIMGDMLFGSGTTAPPLERSSWRASGILARAILQDATSIFRRKLRSDMLIHTDAIGDEVRGGRWFNRYADPFGDLPSGQAVVLTDMFAWQWHQPRHNKRVFHHAPIQIGAALAARLPGNGASTKLAEAVTALACERADALLGWDMGAPRRAAFVAWAARKIGGLSFRYDAYRRLLDRVQPRLLLGLAGCYGAHAPLIAAARDRDVVTAEFQHGAISAGHDAYNFAPAVFTDEGYRRTLPQYLLTYGEWWNAQIHAPVECVTIGYPMRAEKVARMGVPGKDRRTVLVLADGIEFDLYVDLAHTLARAVAGTGLEVVLRPHPLERRSVVERYGQQVGEIRLDLVHDIYASFSTTHTIVSEVSTGLFEAVGLVDRIVLLNTVKARFAYPAHPFDTADTMQDVIDLISGEIPPSPAVAAHAVWAPEWSERYAWFLAEKVGISK